MSLIIAYTTSMGDVTPLQNHFSEKVTFTEYFKYIIYNGTREEKQEAVETLKLPLFIHNKTVYTHSLG
jgi:hypothetical protein